MKQAFHMFMGCVLPFSLIFALPLFGISEGVAVLAFMVLMLSCHLFMMRGHGPGRHGGTGTVAASNGDDHESS